VKPTQRLAGQLQSSSRAVSIFSLETVLDLILQKIAKLLLAAVLLISAANGQETSQQAGYLPLNRVSAASQRFLLAAGLRLRRPGKERITVAGSIGRGEASPLPVEITWEIPQKIRIDEGRAPVVFGGANPSRDQDSSGILETFLEDSLEGFFTAEAGRSVRFLGSGYRFRAPGSDGRSFEIIEVRASSRFRNGSQTTVKQYWFDARTRLLARVTYRVAEAPGSEFVEVFWSDWRDVQGEKIPFSVERKESGRTTLQLTFSSAFISPRADDGRFSGR
jgi:hypothetical protein